MPLEEQIKHYRKQAGLSQEKMAEKIGVSRQAITKWENGTGTPDIVNQMAIADLFQISVDELLSNEKSCQSQENLAILGQEKNANFGQKKKANTSDDFQ